MDTVNPGASPAPAYLSVELSARTSASTVVLDGGTVAFWTYEPLQVTPETRTILVVHGFRGDHHGLLRVADQLTDMRLVMPDLPGFGGSAPFPAGGHSVPAYGRFLSSFMAALGLGADTVLLGHSFGS